MQALRIVLPVVILLGGSFVTFVYGKSMALRGRDASLAAGLMATIVLALALVAVIPYQIGIHLPLLPKFMALKPSAGELFKSVPLNPLPTAASIRFTYDSLSAFLTMLALTLGLIVTVYSARYMGEDKGSEKFFALLLLMIAGMVGLAIAADLFTLWVFFELMCVASYVLVAFRKESWEPVEAGVKYLVMSAAGSMTVLLAVSFAFMHLGTLSFEGIAALVKAGGVPITTVTPIAVLFLVGFGVKSAIVPLHTWLPDAHAAAPSGISAMLSGIVIEAGFVALLKTLLLFAQPVAGLGTATGVASTLGLVLIALSLLTMTLGNVVALVQTDLKRMLAYSSVAQMGYILLGVGLFLFSTQVMTGLVGGLFHILTHAFMKALAFLCAGIVIHRIHSRTIADMSGLATVMPVTAVCFAVAALSLAGVPPFSGFMSKLLIYKAGIDLAAVAGGALGLGLICTVIAIINSVISLGYYLPVIQTMFAPAVSEKLAGGHDAPASMLAAVVLLALITLALGLFPDLGLRVVNPAAAEISRFLTVPVL